MNNSNVQTFESTFAKAIEDYLLSIRSDNERLERNYDNYKKIKAFFFSSTGIRALGIKRDTYIATRYFNDVKEFNLETIVQEFQNADNVAVFVNLTKRFVVNIEQRFKTRIIFLNELKDIDIKENERFVESAKTKGKCLNIEEIERYISFIFRIKMLSSFFQKESISPSSIVLPDIKRKEIFPFVYERYGSKYIFYENKRSLLEYYEEFMNRHSEDIIFEQVSVSRGEEQLSSRIHITISEKREILFEKRNTESINRKIIEIEKVNETDLTKMSILYPYYRNYSLTDFYPIYKYRPFEKQRYSKSEEIILYTSTPTLYPESYQICVGSRCAIEKDSIWFSTYEALNDPFDLAIREPELRRSVLPSFETLYEAYDYNVSLDSGLSVFCTTRKNDNILMWSHYGDSHKGMCTTYLQNELIDVISNDQTVGLCLYGNVKYSSKRPQFVVTGSMLRYFSYELLLAIFNIRNLFEKYKDWSYEEEVRFIIFPIDEIEKGKYIKNKGHAMVLKAIEFIFGNKFDDTQYSSYLSNAGVSLQKFDLSSTDYLLT